MGLGTAALGLTLGAMGTAFNSMASKKAGEEAQDAADKFADRLTDLARATGLSPEELIFAFSNPNLGNAPLGAASVGVLQQLGFPVAGSLAQASPQGLLLNAAGAGGLTGDEFNETRGALQFYNAQLQKHMDAGDSFEVAHRKAVRRIGPEGQRRVARAAGLAGFGGLLDYAQAQGEFNTRAAEIQAASAAVAPEVQQGRMDALRHIAQLQSDFPVATREGIAQTEGQVRAERMREIERARQERTSQILEMANLNRINPGGILGELEEEVADERFRLENTGALERALTLLQGQTNLGAAGLNALQGSFNAPLAAGTNVGNVLQQGTAHQGSLAARQAIAMNDLQVRQELFKQELRALAHEARAGGDIADIQGKLAAAQNAANFTSQTGSTFTSFGMGGGSFANGQVNPPSSGSQGGGNIVLDLSGFLGQSAPATGG